MYAPCFFCFLILLHPLFGEVNSSSQNPNIELQAKLLRQHQDLVDEFYITETQKILGLLMPIDQKHTDNESLFPLKHEKGYEPMPIPYFDPSLEVWIKPRGNEFFFWEIAGILGCTKFIPPAIPFYHCGQLCSIQKHCPSIICGPLFISMSPCAKTVSVRNFWEFNIIAFLFGLKDLNGKNIGVSRRGDVWLFDFERFDSTEIISQYPIEVGSYKTLYTSFTSMSFDWPQFLKPLTMQDANAIIQLLEAISHRLSNLSDISKFMTFASLYMPIEHIENYLNNMLEKLNLLKGIEIKPGLTFKDLYLELFPKLKNQESKVKAIAGKLWPGFSGGFGSIIMKFHTTTNLIDLNPTGLKELTEWVNSLYQSRKIKT